MSQEGSAAVDAEFDAGLDPELWDLEEDDGRGDGRLRGGACSGWAAGRSNGVKGTKSCNGEPPITQPPKKTRTTAPADAALGGAQSSQAQRLSARAIMNPKDTEHLSLSQRACAIIPALADS